MPRRRRATVRRGVDGAGHVGEPAVALVGADVERRCGASAAGGGRARRSTWSARPSTARGTACSRWRAPVRSGASGYSAQQHVVAGHAGVERVDEPLEERLAADDRRTASSDVRRLRPPGHGTVAAMAVSRNRESLLPARRSLDYIAERDARRPTTCCSRCTTRTADASAGAAGMQVSADQGALLTLADPARRRPQRRRGRHVHRLLVDLHRPRPGARRARCCAATSARSSRRSPGEAWAERRAERPHRAAPGPGARDAAGAARRRADRPRVHRRRQGRLRRVLRRARAPRPPGRAAARRQHAVVGPRRRRRRPTDADTVGHQGVQRQGRRRRPRRELPAPDRRRRSR